MEKRFELFNNVLTTLIDNEVLENLILIGGWCPYFYKFYFNNAPEIPALRTMDIDFLIPRPLSIKNDVDVGSVLEQLGFSPEHSQLTGYVKFVHPDLEIEFLTPEYGKGEDKPFYVKKLHISAQQLRYLNLLQKYTIEVPFGKSKIRVPEPSAYVLHKFILSTKRKDNKKKEKDIIAAKEMGEFLLQSMEERNKLMKIYRDSPKGWQKTLNKILKHSFNDLYSFLKDK